MHDLTKTIETLISLKKEGEYWDFKLKHHENPADLVKDLLCLANTIRHKGERYLIFGISNSYEIKGVQGTPRATQAQIITTLQNASFPNGEQPDITLHTITIQNSEIDVLTIADKPQKPYYLESDYKIGNKTIVRAGTIYSRIQDRNTSSDSVAPFLDIEHMWRERFGLDNPPLERLKAYLLDFDRWKKTDELEWHYTAFPEFTIKPTDEEIREINDAAENWIRAATNPKAFVRPMEIKFHQTVLVRKDCILFDEMRAILPAPKAVNVDTVNPRRFYYFCEDDFDFIFLQFLLKKKTEDLIKNGIPSGRINKVPIIIFPSKKVKNAFVSDIAKNPIDVEARHEFTDHRLDPLVTQRDRDIIAYCNAVIERFHNSRQCH